MNTKQQIFNFIIYHLSVL